VTAHDIEFALICVHDSKFNYRRWLVVPNVSWGVRGIDHECDLLAVSGSGYAHEIEIKVSVSDLRRDRTKRHGHYSELIRCLWFAGPKAMQEQLLAESPERAGVIVADDGRARVMREATPSNAPKLSDAQLLAVARLGTMRYWTRRDPSREPPQLQLIGEVI